MRLASLASLSCFALALALTATALPARAETADAGVASPARRLRLVRRDRTAFGTQVQIIAAAATDVEARLVAAHLEAAFAEIKRVANLVDADRADSPIARINDAAGRAPVKVDPETFALLLEAERLAKLTRGAFDPTFAALRGVWRFSRDDPPRPTLPTADAGPPAPAPPVAGPPSPPPDALVLHFQDLVDHHDLVLDPAAKTAMLKRAGQRIGLGGLAKGYALDQAAKILEGRGVSDFIVTAGGDLVVRGKKGDQPWMVGIQDPRASGHFAALPASPGAVMTTGDYERFFFDDKTRLHHVIDPRTGRPAEGSRSVTVLAPDGIVADALSTAVFVLGPDEGLKLVERLAGVEALVVTADNSVRISKGLEGKVRFRPPTDAP